ncbi:MAG: glycosyltransferase family 2 protein [Mariniblastus sp.]|nr:glycosyltransferase family 2 protein [Mariniblastus sp.]
METEPVLCRETSQLGAIIERLSDCPELVEPQLQVYSQANISSGDGLQTDYQLSVVIPVFNEVNTIIRVITRVAALPLNTEIVVVDDHSDDGTRDLLERLEAIDGIRLIFQPENQGKGAALRTGFECCSGDFVVVQDADLEYDPRDIPRLLEPLLRGDADVVYGSRFMGSEPQDESLVHRMGNAMLTGASNLLSGLRLTDMETCYKAFTLDVIESIRIEQDRFGIEPEITAKLARRGFRFVEVPISYNGRRYNEGKKIGVRDLFNAIYCIGRYGVSD